MSSNHSSDSTTFFDRFIDGFVNIFGSKIHFALAVAGAIVVVALLFTQGYQHWLLTTGLASNNYESAVEYFLAVATLYQTARITIRQGQQRERDEAQMDRMETLEDKMEELILENTRLTREVHDALIKVKEVTE